MIRSNLPDKSGNPDSFSFIASRALLQTHIIFDILYKESNIYNGIFLNVILVLIRVLWVLLLKNT